MSERRRGLGRRHKEQRAAREFVEFADAGKGLIEHAFGHLAGLPEFQAAFTHSVLGVSHPEGASENLQKERAMWEGRSQSSGNFTVLFERNSSTYTVEYRVIPGIGTVQSLAIFGVPEGGNKFTDGWHIDIERHITDRPASEFISVRETDSPAGGELYSALTSMPVKREDKYYYMDHSRNTVEEVLPKAKELIDSI